MSSQLRHLKPAVQQDLHLAPVSVPRLVTSTPYSTSVQAAFSGKPAYLALFSIETKPKLPVFYSFNLNTASALSPERPERCHQWTNFRTF